jgi:hypothetical protein
VKWTRAVHHLRELAEKCAELDGQPRSFYRFRVVALWAVGEILGAARDLDRVSVALVVDLPVGEVPWLSEPDGAEHWANGTRMSRNPIKPFWRSAHAPVWNHHVDRPALLWDAETGLAEETFAALLNGRGAEVRAGAPSPAELRTRLEDELAVSLGALREQTRAYEERRWSPGKLTPVSDALWRASDGYLDLLDELNRGG